MCLFQAHVPIICDRRFFCTRECNDGIMGVPHYIYAIMGVPHDGIMGVPHSISAIMHSEV